MLPTEILKSRFAAAVFGLVVSCDVVAQQISQGIVAHGAGSTGGDGTGVRLGVIARPISQAKLDALVTAGELPAGVVVVTSESSVTEGDDDLGLDMLQIAHDMAPSATLSFVAPAATGSTPTVAPTSCLNVTTGLLDGAGALTAEGAFLCAVDALVNQGVDIILDGLPAIDQSPFHDGRVALAIGALGEAIPYVVAAGEEGSRAVNGSYSANTIYEAGFNPIDLPAGLELGIGFEYVEKIHSFGSNATYLTIEEDLRELCLYWADQPDASVNDYELFVLESSDAAEPLAVLAHSAGFQYNGGGQAASECISDPAVLGAGKRVVVGTDALVAASRFLHIRGESVDPLAALSTPLFSITTGGAIRGRAALPNVITVGAAPAPQVVGVYRQFEAGDSPTGYSSAGDRAVFYAWSDNEYVAYGDNQDDLAASAVVRPKPDVAGADEVSVARVTGSGDQLTIVGANAYGSPVAAAHIAGLVARARVSYGFDAAEVLGAMKRASVDLGLTGRDTATGYGAPLLQSLINEITKPMPPSNAAISYGVASATVSFDPSSDDQGFTYSGQCFQTSPVGTQSLVYSSSNIESGQSFTVLPGYTAFCNLVANNGEIDSDLVVAQYDPNSGSSSGSLAVAGQLAASSYQASSDANGFVVRYILDGAGQHSTSLQCTNSVGLVVVDDTQDPAPQYGTYEDLTPNVPLNCSLIITSSVAGVVQESASLDTTFQIVPDEEVAGLPLWLLYEVIQTSNQSSN